jgi:hypothetical protein
MRRETHRTPTGFSLGIIVVGAGRVASLPTSLFGGASVGRTNILFIISCVFSRPNLSKNASLPLLQTPHPQITNRLRQLLR